MQQLRLQRSIAQVTLVMRLCSGASVGLWSKDMAMAFPLSDTTQRESPAFATNRVSPCTCNTSIGSPNPYLQHACFVPSTTDTVVL